MSNYPNSDRYSAILPVPVQTLFAAVEDTACGITICDAQKADMPIIYVNPAFQSLTGYAANQVVGKNCRFLQGEDKAQDGIRIIRQAVLEQTSVNVTLRNYKKDGSLFWNNLVLSPVFSEVGMLTHFIGIQTDITQMVQLKRERDDFVATLIHDLKNPLIGFTRMFEVINSQNLTAADRSKFMLMLQDGAESMLRLTLNALDFYKQDGSPFVPALRPLDLTELCDRVTKELSFSVNRKNLKLKLESDEKSSFVLADEVMVRRILVNLLDNAIKFTPSQDSISIKVNRRTDSTVSVCITNSSFHATLPETLIFDRFRQGTRNAACQDGTGLGLYLCRKLILAQNGSIDARVDGNKVSVSFSLPAFSFN